MLKAKNIAESSLVCCNEIYIYIEMILIKAQTAPARISCSRSHGMLVRYSLTFARCGMVDSTNMVAAQMIV